MAPAGTPDTLHEQRVNHVTCLGCGCACDDVTVRVDGGRIREAINACELGRAWFGDGSVPAAIRVGDAEASLEAAVGAIAAMLAAARAPLVYVAPDLSCEAQREAIALADVLHARLETITGQTALASIIAAQERGRAGATLGELRNRADVVVFWAVDPDLRYPRYRSRYVPDPAGLYTRDGRRSRTVIAVDVGDARGPLDANLRIDVAPDEEVALLTAAAAIVRQSRLQAHESLHARAESLAAALTGGRYSAIVADAELSSGTAGRAGLSGSEGSQTRDPQRAAALVALAQALNGPSRCALSTLRSGGNRCGADAVVTSQTGYPTSVDFSPGYPQYRPYDRDLYSDVAVIVGDASGVSPEVMEKLSRTTLAIIGPRATAHAAARIAIDTGTAGIHCGGTALRMDDVPLPLRPSVDGHRDPLNVVRAVVSGVVRGAVGPTPANLTGLAPPAGTNDSSESLPSTARRAR